LISAATAVFDENFKLILMETLHPALLLALTVNLSADVVATLGPADNAAQLRKVHCTIVETQRVATKQSITVVFALGRHLQVCFEVDRSEQEFAAAAGHSQITLQACPLR
jgi:hypothetical protein